MSGEPHPDRVAVYTTAARLLVRHYDRAFTESESDLSTIWLYLPDSWHSIAYKLVLSLVMEADNAAQAAQARRAVGEQDFTCPVCGSCYFRMSYHPGRTAAGIPPYRVICARCQAGANITESSTVDGSDRRTWRPGP